MNEEEKILQVFENTGDFGCYYLGDYSNLDIAKFIRKILSENVELKENYKAILKQRDDTNKSAVETIEKYQQENARLKEIENKLIFIKNRVKQGMSQENINKCAIELVNSYLKEN